MSKLPRPLDTSLLLTLLVGATGAFPQSLQTPPVVPLLPAPAPAPAAAAELPAFQPGLWEYERTVLTAANPKPQKTSLRKCSDPSREIRQRKSELQLKGCEFSPVLARGKQYLSTWRCPVGGGALIDRNVVTVNSTTSYQDDNVVHAGEHTSRSTVIANRVGECPAPGASTAQAPPKP